MDNLVKQKKQLNRYMRISAESVKKAVVEKCQDRERGKGCKSDEEGRVCIACLSYRQSARE